MLSEHANHPSAQHYVPVLLSVLRHRDNSEGVLPSTRAAAEQLHAEESAVQTPDSRGVNRWMEVRRRTQALDTGGMTFVGFCLVACVYAASLHPLAAEAPDLRRCRCEADCWAVLAASTSLLSAMTDMCG